MVEDLIVMEVRIAVNNLGKNLRFLVKAILLEKILINWIEKNTTIFLQTCTTSKSADSVLLLPTVFILFTINYTI